VTALWHFGEDASLSRFVPRDDRVWAIDNSHSWLYWFPRDCPWACFWAVESSTDEDVERWLDGDGDRDRRVAVIETAWLERMRDVKLLAYRIPPEPFDVRPSRWTRSSSSSSATSLRAMPRPGTSSVSCRLSIRSGAT
jgi:hypothetical protein